MAREVQGYNFEPEYSLEQIEENSCLEGQWKKIYQILMTYLRGSRDLTGVCGGVCVSPNVECQCCCEHEKIKDKRDLWFIRRVYHINRQVYWCLTGAGCYLHHIAPYL